MPEQTELEPATSLRDTFNAVNPARPLPSGDARYVDCTDVRGNEDIVEQLFDTITWSDELTTQLFTGHRGCGKSTELLRLKARLEQAGFAVIYFEADDYLDLNDIIYTDVLVAIARRVYEGLTDLEVDLNSELLEEVHEWFADVVYSKEEREVGEAGVATEAGIGVSSPFATLMARVTGQLKTSTEKKKQIRRRLDPQVSLLIENINLLLQDGERKLRGQGKEGLAVIIDNLDRISFRELDDHGRRNTHDALYIEHGEQLRALQCHLVYTVPIAMFYSVQASILRGIFPECPILPMIKTRTQDGDVHDAGVEAMCDMLGRRIDLDRMFTDDALTLLIESSGGHPRDLMILVRYACRYAADRYPKPIDEGAAEKAVERLVSEYSRMIPEDHYPLLAAVHREKEVENDDTHRQMLHNLSVLEYRNGAPPWHDVHPVVLRLPKFKEALENEYADTD